MTQKIDVSTAGKISLVLHEMMDKKEKINVSQVAKRLGLSHSAIYKLYPDKLVEIQKAQRHQKSMKESVDVGVKVEKLKKDIAALNKNAAENKQLVNSYKEQNEILWEHIQQVYNMYDEMLAERNAFAQRLENG